MVEIFVFILGSFFGSFANVCIRRIPQNKSIVIPPSHCPKCNAKIKFYDNIPIISFLFLKGRCRNCGEKISLEYPLLEFIMGLLFLLSYYRFGSATEFYFFSVLFLYLVIISFIDYHHLIIPDELSISLIIFGLGISHWNSFLPLTFSPFRMLTSILGLITGGLFLFLIAVIGEKIFKKEAMGGGDIKLAAAAGSFIGLKNILLSLILASVIGAIVGVFLIILKKKKKDETIPFGPHIALGVILTVLLGEKILFFFNRYIIFKG